MNLALADVFLANLPKAIHKMYEPICMKDPNKVFLYMFDWFIERYGKTTSEDHEANRQRMAANWHPSEGFKPLATHLFIGTSYASAARYSCPWRPSALCRPPPGALNNSKLLSTVRPLPTC
jgi:hypothetical protein